MFRFYQPPVKTTHKATTRYGTVPAGIADVKSLLAAAGKALAFPPFYGKNFDAFWDCVRDLQCREHKAVLIHQDLPAIGDEDLGTYLTLLRDATLYWKQRAREHRFEAWFPAASEERAKAILAAAPPEDVD